MTTIKPDDVCEVCNRRYTDHYFGVGAIGSIAYCNPGHLTLFKPKQMKEERKILMMNFVDESESFAFGFEAGRIWALLGNGEEIIDLAVHTKNMNQIYLILEAYGIKNVQIEKYDDTWTYLTVEKTMI